VVDEETKAEESEDQLDVPLVKKATSKKASTALNKGACRSYARSSKLVRKRATKLAAMAGTTEAVGDTPSLQELINLREFWCAEKIAAGEECDRLTALINSISP